MINHPPRSDMGSHGRTTRRHFLGSERCACFRTSLLMNDVLATGLSNARPFLTMQRAQQLGQAMMANRSSSFERGFDAISFASPCLTSHQRFLTSSYLTPLTSRVTFSSPRRPTLV